MSPFEENFMIGFWSTESKRTEEKQQRGEERKKKRKRRTI